MAAKKKANITVLNAIQKQCISGLKCSEAERNSIPVGVHHIDFLVRIFGTLTVNEDEKVIPTTSVLSIPVLALAFKRMGIQRQRFIDTVTQIVNEATAEGLSATDSVKADVEGIEEDMKRLSNELAAKLEKVPRKGKCMKGLVMDVQKSEITVNKIKAKVVRNKSTMTEAAAADRGVTV